MAPQQPSIPPGLLLGVGTEFVGRTRELQQFAEIWASVNSGHRQVVFVGGEPGAGKSRLAAEVARACFDDGAVVSLGSNSRDLGYALQPFVEVLNSLFASSGIDIADIVSEKTVAALLPVSRSLPSESGGQDPMRPAGDPADVFGAVTELIRSLAKVQPVVMVLENLNWAGPHTRTLLSHLVQSTSEDRLLIIGTHRTTAPDRNDELTLAIAELYGLTGVTRIDLTGLETDDIVRYLVAVSGLSQQGARQPAAILRDQTGGNPFFLEETWRDLDQKGGVQTLAERASEIPRTVRDMLELRLQTMAPATLAVLERAAVIGDQIDVGLLVATGLALEQVLSALDIGVGYGFISRQGVQDLEFRHSLLKQAVIDRLPRHEQVTIHAAVAVALEAEGRSAPDTLAALAHHYEQAAPLGYAGKAAEYLAKSAVAARASLAHAEAAARFDLAANLAEAPDAVELRFEAAASLSEAGSLSEARYRYRELAGSDEPARLARAAVGFEQAAWLDNAEPEVSIELLTKALSGLEASSPWHRLATASLGRALLVAGAVAESRRVGEAALDRARREGEPEEIIHALMCLVLHMWEPHELVRQAERCNELVLLARSHGNHMGMALGFGAGTMAAYRLGSAEEFHDHMEGVSRVAAAVRQPAVTLSAGCAQFAAHYLRGRFAQAGEVADRLVQEGEPFGEDNAQGVFGMQMFALRRATGALAQMPRAVIEEATETGRWKPGALALYVELGAEDQVERLLPGAVLSCEEMSTISAQWAALAVFTVEAICLVGDRAAAERVRPLLEPFSGMNLIAGHLLLPFGSADRYLALLDHVLGRPTAREHFERALEMDRRMESLVHEAETLRSFAAHLESLGESVESAELGRRGRAIAERIGLRRRFPLEDQGNGAAVPFAEGELLSPRETDVLRLLALGMSNREIGDELMISANTAANHVRSILMKTGLANRTQAAVYAANHGLV